ncbi:MAG: hypothetical protein QG640_29 [Patescibacteria group bacterium]|nr:hypothetical protein [Patescibacteria group bacterium]
MTGQAIKVKFFHYLRLLSLPLLFLLLSSSLNIVWKIFDLPETEVLTSIVKVWFDAYGLPILFLSSILEGMLLIGSYFPGVFVIFVSVVLSDTIPQMAAAILVATIGLMIAHVGNYVLGKYGWYRLLVKFGMKRSIEAAQEKLVKKGPIAIMSSYWLPSMGALTDTAAGIIQMPFKKFIVYSIGSAIFWDTFVAVIVYNVGNGALKIASGGSSITFLVVGIWIAIVLIFDWFERRKENQAQRAITANSSGKDSI